MIHNNIPYEECKDEFEHEEIQGQYELKEQLMKELINRYNGLKYLKRNRIQTASEFRMLKYNSPYSFINDNFVKTYDDYEELHCTMIDRYYMFKELNKYFKLNQNKIFGIKYLNYI